MSRHFIHPLTMLGLFVLGGLAQPISGLAGNLRCQQTDTQSAVWVASAMWGSLLSSCANTFATGRAESGTASDDIGGCPAGADFSLRTIHVDGRRQTNRTNGAASVLVPITGAGGFPPFRT